jgi:hypothetical protein
LKCLSRREREREREREEFIDIGAAAGHAS